MAKIKEDSDVVGRIYLETKSSSKLYGWRRWVKDWR